jgi:hypothetical protein
MTQTLRADVSAAHAPRSIPAHRDRLQIQLIMIRPRQKIFPMMFPRNPNPVERAIRQRNLLQHVTIFRHPQNHAMFQPRAEHRMRFVKISAGIISVKGSRPHHNSINLHRRAHRRTRNIERLRPQSRPNRRESQRRDDHRQKISAPTAPHRLHVNPQRGKVRTVPHANKPVNAYKYAPATHLRGSFRPQIAAKGAPFRSP